MALTIAAFRERWTAFANATTYPDTYVDLVLQEALRRINADYFRNRADDAQGYLTAHLIEVKRPQRGAGVQSVSAGPASITYFPPTTRKALETTSYGLEYLALLKSVGPASRVL